MAKTTKDSKSSLMPSLFDHEEAPNPLRKAVEVVHSVPSTALGVTDRKVLNVWLKNVHESKPDENGWYVISMQRMLELMKFNSNNRDPVIKAAKGMMSVIFEWDVLATPQGKRPEWKASVLFPEVEVHSDHVRYQVSNQVRPELERPTIYALIDLNVSSKLRRTGSMGLYEFCVRYEKVGRTAKVEWKKLRDMILGKGAQTKYYDEYKRFKSKVLNPSLAELNAESPLELTLHEFRVGKSVDTIQFSMIAKTGAAGEETTDDEVKELVALMTTLGVPLSEAKKLAGQHDSMAIRGAVEYTRKRQQNKTQGRLANAAAYFRAALLQGYADSGAPRAEDRARPAQEPVKKIDLLEEYLADQTDQAVGYFKELDAGDQSELMERYNAKAIPHLQLGKKRNKASERAFYRWLAIETWGEPTSDQLLSFAATQLAKKAK